MIIFIDESGDLGQNISRGSSKIFVIAMIIFKKNSDIEHASFKIGELRKSLGKSKYYEFKFNKMRKSERIKFLINIKSENFEVKTLIVRKDNDFIGNVKGFDYGSLLGMLLIRNKNSIKNAQIRLDKIGGKEYKKLINVYLRKILNDGTNKNIIKEFKFVDSKDNNLIQLADIIAGSINRHYQDSKGDSNIYKEIIEEKIKDEWFVK